MQKSGDGPFFHFQTLRIEKFWGKILYRYEKLGNWMSNTFCAVLMLKDYCLLHNEIIIIYLCLFFSSVWRKGSWPFHYKENNIHIANGVFFISFLSFPFFLHQYGFSLLHQLIYHSYNFFYRNEDNLNKNQPISYTLYTT